MHTNSAQPSNLVLWFSILAGPAAWAMHLSVEYFLTTAQCELAAGDTGLLMFASTAALLGLALAGLYSGVVARRETERVAFDRTVETKRRHFMATCGVLLSLLFLAGIVMATIPIILLEPCLAA